MRQTNLLISNQACPARGGKTFVRTDPFTGAEATHAAAASTEDVDAAVEAASRAFGAWSRTGPTERRALLYAAAERLESKRDVFAQTMTSETGATLNWGYFNVQLAANMLREAASLTTQIQGSVIPSDVPGNLALAVRQPVGVLLGIAPWNAPVILGVRALAMPLACGNTMVFKASERSPATHRLIGDCFLEAGFPPGVVNVLTHAPEDASPIVQRLIRHPAVRRINFTGSTEVGRIIAKEAAACLKPVLLELGGKAPVVVLDDADLDEAVNATVFGAFANQGQICMSTERAIVDAKVADEFIAKLSQRATALTLGDGRKNCHLGALVDPQSAADLAGLIGDAVDKGAELAAGGPAEGVMMHATILDRVDSTMRVYAEESFGPLLSVLRVSGDQEAIERANDTPFGLSGAVFSRDITRALHVAHSINSGICHINGATVHDEAQMPFGGVGSSGYGRFGGLASIDEFTTLRWLTLQTGQRAYPF